MTSDWDNIAVEDLYHLLDWDDIYYENLIKQIIAIRDKQVKEENKNIPLLLRKQ